MPKKKPIPTNANASDPAATQAAGAKYPRQTVDEALRAPRAILDQNAGRPCTVKEAAAFVGVGGGGDFQVEVSSATKYGFLDRPEQGKVLPTERARRIIRPQTEQDEILAVREAILEAPGLSEVYHHYRGENFPDDTFFRNTVVDTYGVPAEKVDEFKRIFLASLERGGLVEKHGDKLRLLDVTEEPAAAPEDRSARIKKLGKAAKVDAGDTGFVMQPFAAPLGDYYDKIYRPAIEKAGLKAVRADAEIFGTGKIMDQVWRGIQAAKVLVAELTSRIPTSSTNSASRTHSRSR